MRIFMIRHGLTEYNSQWRYQGWSDIPLSDEGREQIRTAAKMPKLVYVSHLCRSSQTAQLIFPGVRQIVHPGLSEMNFGRFEGRTYEEMMADDPEYARWIADGGTGKCPGGESREEFVERVQAAIAEIVHERELAGDQEVTIVAHGGTLMAALCRCVNTPGEYRPYLCGNVEGYEAEYTAGEEFPFRVLRRLDYQKEPALLHLYYGEGRGKSSAAMSLALRSLNAGRAVYILCLCKAAGSGETEQLKKLGAEVIYGKADKGFVSAMDEAERYKLRERQSGLLKECMDKIKKSNERSLLIIDEACAALKYGVIDEAVLWDAALRRPSKLELVLSGREPAQWMLDAADYITRMDCVRHPFSEGIAAREGIEY